jgi:hypothetical protein
MKAIPLLVAALLVVANWAVAEKEPDLDDPKVREKILKEAVPMMRPYLDWRGPQGGEQVIYQKGKQTPYTGRVKMVCNKGQVKLLGYYVDGKREGAWTTWHENGRKETEQHYKAGEMDGLWTWWNKDGKVVMETRATSPIRNQTYPSPGLTARGGALTRRRVPLSYRESAPCVFSYSTSSRLNRRRSFMARSRV